MFSTLRTRFGIPGVISVIALVFAMLGGAYAATQQGGNGKATASAKAKKGQRGPKGATGPAGPTGPAGAPGAKGADGAAGEDGEKGKNGNTGPKGADGLSVSNTPEPPGANCANGGTQLEGAEGTSYVCDGAEGSPWTLGGTLPPGETETGAWSFGKVPAVTCTVEGVQAAEEAEAKCNAKLEPSGPLPCCGVEHIDPAYVPISFTIPMAEEIPAANTWYVKVGETGLTGCPGSAADPQADPGYLCVYATQSSGEFNAAGFDGNGFVGAGTGAEGASTSGAMLPITKYKQRDFAFGTWAVTAPTPAP